MKTQNYNVLIVMGLAFALAPTLVMARTSAGESAKGYDEGKPATSSPTATHESPFACDRLALDPEARRRHFVELGPALRGLKEGVRELSDRYEFQLHASDARRSELIQSAWQRPTVVHLRA